MPADRLTAHRLGTEHAAGCGKMTVMPFTRQFARALPRGRATLTAAALACAATMLAACTSVSSSAPDPPRAVGSGAAARRPSSG